MSTCFDVANYFLSQSSDDAGDLISNLKLQKLVYYAQGFSLALLGKPLFEEEIEAWMHGPVVPELYRKYRDHGSEGIPAPADFDPSEHFNKQQIALLREVNEMYGQFSAWKLRNLTHEEAPWIENYKEGWSSGIIPKRQMEEFFKEHLLA